MFRFTIAIPPLTTQCRLAFGKQNAQLFGCISAAKTPVPQRELATAVNAPSQGTKTDGVKSFDEIPTLKRSVFTILPLLMNSRGKQSGRKAELHKITETFRMLGPIYREKIGTLDLLYVADVNAVEQLVRQDDVSPKRMSIDSWVAYREEKDESPGVFTAEGTEWSRMRKLVDKPLLQMKYMEGYTDSLNPVVEDFLQHLVSVRGEDLTIPQLDQEFFNWALESVGTLLYGRRLGLFEENVDENTKKFVESVATMFDLTHSLIFFPAKVSKILFPFKWRKFTECWDTFFTVANQCLRDFDSAEGKSILSNFLSQKDLTEKEITGNLTELMAAGVDTTSNTILWILYELARHQEAQDRLVKEVNDIIPKGMHPTYKHIKQMPYLKAVVKETMRFHSPVLSVTRVLQKDAEVLGYHIPAKTNVMMMTYVLCQSPDIFDNPEEYRPERWFRENRSANHNNFAFLPFGVGTRMCVGRRIAELEMYLVLSQLCRRFRVELSDDEPLEPTLRLLYVPDRQVPVRFRDRTN